MKDKKPKLGRKPLGENKKERVDLFVPQTTIKKLGKSNIIEMAYGVIDNALNDQKYASLKPAGNIY
jgi:hypothetical protein